MCSVLACHQDACLQRLSRRYTYGRTWRILGRACSHVSCGIPISKSSGPPSENRKEQLRKQRMAIIQDAQIWVNVSLVIFVLFCTKISFIENFHYQLKTEGVSRRLNLLHSMQR